MKLEPILKLSLIKMNHVFIINYKKGEEDEVLKHLVDMVNNPNLNFDWLDAAILSHQLGQHLNKELKSYFLKS